jgi:putative SOS response-associated peptidase YedK
MCVRYNRDLSRIEVWCQHRETWVPPDYVAPQNKDDDAFPGERSPIIVRDEEHGTRLVAATWGLMPFWAKESTFGKKNAYNARRETVHEKPTFAKAFKARRCLIPATGFYERANKRWLKMGPKDDVFAIAGLFEPPNKMAEETTFTMITTDPNQVVEEYHDRMPVILAEEDYAAWMDPATPIPDLLALLLPCDPSFMTVEDAGPIGAPRVPKGESPS